MADAATKRDGLQLALGLCTPSKRETPSISRSDAPVTRPVFEDETHDGRGAEANVARETAP